MFCSGFFESGQLSLWNKYLGGNMDDMICYCFNYTAADIERDVLTNGRSTIMEKILSEKKIGGCQCADKNPKGR
jgi:hypothetical protein